MDWPRAGKSSFAFVALLLNACLNRPVSDNEIEPESSENNKAGESEGDEHVENRIPDLADADANEGNFDSPDFDVFPNDESRSSLENGTGEEADEFGDGLGEECPPEPAKLLFLGDSVAACSVIGGPFSEGCASQSLFSRLSASFESLSYENFANSGARYHNVVNQQLERVESSSEHLVVVLFVGGNDLLDLIFLGDAEAVETFSDVYGTLEDHLELVLDSFDDAERFADGVTLILNAQFNPWDDCPGFPMSAAKIEILHDYNAMVADHEDRSKGIYFTNGHEPFLGHGHNFDQSHCPYYSEGAENYMEDAIHPNLLGNEVLADLWLDTFWLSRIGCEE